MNCNCKNEIEAKLLGRFKAESPQATGHSVELTGYGFGVTDNGIVIVGCMPIKSTAIFTPKNGGAGKAKTITQSMHFSYCPFCGAKATGGEA